MTPAALPFIIVGNPDNRRVTLFQQALANLQQPSATVVAWQDLIEDPSRLAAVPDRPAILRIESAGESFEVERALLRLGYPAARSEGVSTIAPGPLARLRYDRGRILAPRQLHLGFLRVLEALSRVIAERPAWRVLTPIPAIVELFDKRITSRRYAEAGIPVPPALPGVGSPAALRAAMTERGFGSVFVKLSSGSSASCLGVYHHAAGGDDWLMTTIEDTPGAWYNTLRVRRINAPARIDRLLGFLIREGSQIEQAIPKARLDGAYFDCRVLVVAGEPAFVVARQSRHPITNLHLGGWRGAPASLEAQVPAPVRAAALQSCARVAALHGCFQVGVDVMYEADLGGHRVLEANAFGDLLPNLSREGLSVYEWEIRQALGFNSP